MRLARGRRTGIVLGLLCAAGAVSAALSILGEWRVHIIAAGAMTRSSIVRDDLIARYANPPYDDLPPRAAVPLAEMAVEAAETAQDRGLHDLSLQQADGLLRAAAKARPDWGSADVVAAHYLYQRDRTLSAEALARYARSYRAAPYLKGEAMWRIAFGALAWRQLSAETRTAMIEEAVWLCNFDDGQRARVEALLGGSPAAVRFELRLAGTRGT